ncbi:MAG: hypothetical protein ACI81P_002041 [Neolewinella sp.]|jgi:hypothetical protein
MVMVGWGLLMGREWPKCYPEVKTKLVVCQH